MSDFTTRMKTMLNQGAKFVGKAASNSAKATKFKVNELSMLGKRRELIKELGEAVYGLTKQGLILPAEATKITEQLGAVEADLATLRADYEAEKAARTMQKAETVHEPCVASATVDTQECADEADAEESDKEEP